MKTKQRSALTQERQQRLATGGGLPMQDAEVDPDIMLIAPNLNTTAPILFPSNMGEAEVAAKRDVVNMMECDDYFNIEALYEDSENDESLLDDDMTFGDNFVGPSTSGVIGQRKLFVETFESRKKYAKAININNFSKEPTFDVSEIKRSVVANSKSCKRGGKENTCHEEKSYTTERLTKIILQEEKLFCQKLNHEQEIEIRTAAATANLAELQLLNEKNKNRDCFQYNS